LAHGAVKKNFGENAPGEGAYKGRWRNKRSRRKTALTLRRDVDQESNLTFNNKKKRSLRLASVAAVQKNSMNGFARGIGLTFVSTLYPKLVKKLAGEPPPNYPNAL